MKNQEYNNLTQKAKLQKMTDIICLIPIAKWKAAKNRKAGYITNLNGAEIRLITYLIYNPFSRCSVDYFEFIIDGVRLGYAQTSEKLSLLYYEIERDINPEIDEKRKLKEATKSDIDIAFDKLTKL